AVVADEVRKLAERSAKATGEVAQLIAAVQKGTEETVVSMHSGVQEVESGSSLAYEAGKSLDRIIDAVEETDMVIIEIVSAIQELAAKGDQIVNSVESIAAVVSENSASAQEVAASTQEMSSQIEEVVDAVVDLSNMAQELSESVGYFKVKR
ncbi:MAG: methyl-accepting chemotaxis protein, partial [Actinomycetota bacterium]|nr:methyl-accepting chemotaxis protein [Actinomycetota bacterium]